MVGNRAYLLMPRGNRFKDITGYRCGRLVAIRPTTERQGNSVVWECLCDCGNTKYAAQGNLKRGTPKSCGCLPSPHPPRIVKHGVVGHPLYKIWEGMMARCYNSKNKDYDHYGDRGIDVCSRWHDPKNFVADMSPRPAGRSLDRIDNALGYSPENCRWATTFEQAANRRNNKLFTIKGETLHQGEWCRRYNIAVSTFVNRLNEGFDPLTALTLPSRRPKRAVK